MTAEDATMKAYLVNKYKRPMQAGDAAEPTVGDRDALVDIHAAGVNLLDAKIRDGEFKFLLAYHAPFTLGHDLAGVVTRVGSAVTRFTVGDQVYGRPRDHRIGPSPSASPSTRTISRSSPRDSPWPRRPRCPSYSAGRVPPRYLGRAQDALRGRANGCAAPTSGHA